MNPRNSERKGWAARARQQGVEARLAGRPIQTCPYPQGGTLSRLWRDGYSAEDIALRLGEDA